MVADGVGMAARISFCAAVISAVALAGCGGDNATAPEPTPCDLAPGSPECCDSLPAHLRCVTSCEAEPGSPECCRDTPGDPSCDSSNCHDAPGSPGCCAEEPAHPSCPTLCDAAPASTACCDAEPEHPSCETACERWPGSPACCDDSPDDASCGQPCDEGPGSPACCAAEPAHPSCEPPCDSMPGTAACCAGDPEHASCSAVCDDTPGSAACCAADPQHPSCASACETTPGSDACCAAEPTHSSCEPICDAAPGSEACCDSEPDHASCTTACEAWPGSPTCCAEEPSHPSCLTSCETAPGSTACCAEAPSHPSCLTACETAPGSTACCAEEPSHPSCLTPCETAPGSTACCADEPSHPSCLTACEAQPGSSACCGDVPSDASCVAVGLTVTTSDAYEHEGITAAVQLQLDEAHATDVLVTLALTGHSDPTKGDATPADYALEHQDTVIESPITIPAGTTAFAINIVPTADGQPEVPETLSLSVVSGGPVVAAAESTGSVRILDAVPDEANRQLFYAPLRPEPGVVTVASGIVTLQLAGDNDTATIGLDWSGLTSTQTAAHVHVKDPVTGPPIESLPLGPFEAHLWQLRAAQFLTTDQMVLDALLAGDLYVNVHSSDYPAGEIRGDLRPVTGSTTFTPPPPAAPITPLTGDALRFELVRFLNQSTFGATPESLAALEARVASNGGDRIAAMSSWLDEQMDPALTPSPSLYEFAEASRKLYGRTDNSTGSDKRSAWWTFARFGADQLRQRVGFALSQIFVVSDANADVNNYSLGAAEYQDRLLAGAFGPYGDLLSQVSRHPIMGTYLSHLRNRRTQYNNIGQIISHPDENYAREIMQLFSIGLVKRHPDGSLVLSDAGVPIPTYDNAVVTEMAKVFTGLGFSAYQEVEDGPVLTNDDFRLGNGYSSPRYRWRVLMAMFDAEHSAGDKTVFDGIVVPESDGETELDLVHDALASHASTAPFISRRLIQRLVTSNPSPAYLYRVASVFSSSGGDLGDTVRAILLDPEARDPSLRFDRSFGKQREPLIRFLHMLRLTGGYTNLPVDLLLGHSYPTAERAKLPSHASMVRLNWHTGAEDHFGQRPLGARSVFNFFTPDYAPPGPIAQLGLVAPEFQITNEYQVYEMINLVYAYHYWDFLYGDAVPDGYPDDAEDLRRDLAPWQTIHDAGLAANGPTGAATALVDTLDLYLNAGYLRARFGATSTANPRSMMIDGLSQMNDWSRVQEALYILHSNSYSQIQR